MTTTHMLETGGADIAYDLHGPLPTEDGRPPLLMIGQPTGATFEAKGSGAGMAAFIAMTRCCPTGPGRSAATAPTSTPWPLRRRGS